MSLCEEALEGQEHERLASPLPRSTALDFTKYKDLGAQLKPTIAGDVFVRSEEDDDWVNSPLRSLSPGDPLQDEEQMTSAQASTPSGFSESTKLFNAAVPLSAWMVVRPKHTQDVVNTIQFCRSHGLSPSVKSGGFSTAGWSIQGDLVLDMQLMDSVEMMLPQAFKNQAPVEVQVPMDDRAEVDADVHGQLGGEESGITLSSANGGQATVARIEGGGQIDRRAHEREFIDGDATLTEQERKQTADEDTKEAMTEQSEDAGDLPRTKSGESGAEADSESSSAPASRIDSSDESASASQGKRKHQRLSPNQGSAEKGKGKMDWTTDWVDQNMGERSGSDQSANTGITSESSASNGFQSAPTSGGAESEDVEMEPGKRFTASPSPWNPSSTFEHERWQKHHCPPGTSVNRVQLPATGGFIWTADGASSTNRNGTGGPRVLDANESVHLNGSLSHEKRAANGQSSRLPFEQSSIEESISGPSYDAWSASNKADSSNALKPGIYKDNYQLVVLGPGVGIRALDTFTDRAGRVSQYDAVRGKRKAADGVERVKVGENGIDILAKGVPYHVPLSAYPVGSTAMTTGGFGYLSRAYGLSLDNIVEVELVLADGRVKVLNESSKKGSKEDADLWWAVRGAAPCFGVVTRLVAKAYLVPKVYAGNLIYPFNPATAPSLIRHWRDCLKGMGDSIPRELYSNLILTAGPASGSSEDREHVIVIQVCFLGTSAQDDVGHTFVQAISSWTGERVLLKDMAEKSFLNQQDGVAEVLKSGTGRRWMVRGDLLSSLTDDAIHKTAQKFHSQGSNRAVWFFELLGGAIEDERETCVGPQQRSAKFTVAALQQWVQSKEDEKCVTGVDEWVNDVLSGDSVGGPFACFLEREEPKERCQGSFGAENFERLLQIKRSVDPQGMFKHTFASGLTVYM